jgi:hypothetical protein
MVLEKEKARKRNLKAQASQGKKKSNASGSEFQRQKEITAEIMRRKQAEGKLS